MKKTARKKLATATFKVDVEIILADRLLFLAKTIGLGEIEKVVERAIRYYDRAVCGTLDGAKLIAHHKNGKPENFSPFERNHLDERHDRSEVRRPGRNFLLAGDYP